MHKSIKRTLLAPSALVLASLALTIPVSADETDQPEDIETAFLTYSQEPLLTVPNDPAPQ